MNKFFYCASGGFVHHFQTSWNNPGGNDGRYCIGTFFNIVKASHNDSRQLGFSNQLYCNFGHYSKHAFTAHHDRQ